MSKKQGQVDLAQFSSVPPFSDAIPSEWYVLNAMVT